ncbi:RNA methyltransferase-like protein [Elsinoe fawcettii]|nr:RNA methyltransferase-like protein [Elsinoe fawcettii]
MAFEAPNYKPGLDFADLAAADSEFAKYYHNGGLDFHDPRAVQQLTASILRRDFHLSLVLPTDRLCPPVPNRWSYILFLCHLFSSLPGRRPSSGLDIGTGASAIYALLATSSSSPLPKTLSMHATEIDAHSLSFAARNISANDTSSRITLHHVAPSAPLLPLDQLAIPRLDFSMCNPPFYSSEADLLASAEAKDAPASAVCTGSPVEMVCEGGDAGFVLRMVRESKDLGERVRWYTSMLGKLGSVYAVVAELKEVGCGNWVVAVLRGGRKTKRWVVAWSWGDERPGMVLVRGEEVPRALWGLGTEQTVSARGGKERVRDRVDEVMLRLNLEWHWEDQDVGAGRANDNVWSRAARRKKKRSRDDDDEPAVENASGTVALAFRITVSDTGLDVRWLQGRDSVLFESFCGMLKRAMNPA